ncbi:MAG: PepSY-associated TM helix domain-containing protein [Pseudomonadota bacterium]
MTTSKHQTEGGAESSTFVKRMIDSHSVLGLAFAALIYVVSLTGALALFAEEIQLWESPDSLTSASASTEAIAAAAVNAQTQVTPDYEILNVIVTAPTEFRPLLTVRLNERMNRQSPLISTDWIADPDSGELTSLIHAPYAEMVELLHTDLLLPRPWGRYLVGLIGVAMFTLILSGIFAHPTIVKDAFKLRLRSNARMAWTDVHNRLSVWGLPFHLILTFTGAFLGIAGIIVAALALLAYKGDQEAAIQVIQGPQAILERPLLQTPTDYAAMLEHSQADDRQLSLLVANNPEHSGYTTTVAYYEAGILSARTSDIYRNDGEFLQKFGGKGSPAGNRVFGMVQPLHYGTYGGYTIKFFYLILALALTYITSTGMMIWFKRKRQQGQEKQKTEAAWRGMTTGLSLGLAFTGLLAVSIDGLPLVPIFLVLWVIGFVLVYRSVDVLSRVRQLYFCIAAVLVALALTQGFSVLSAHAADQMIPNVINGVLALVGGGFVWLGRRLQTPRLTS